MKDKIAFPQLVELVGEKASTTSRMSELFLQELFATVSQSLIDGKSVKIKGLGTFKTTKGGGETVVLFVPDSDLAEAVNSPFAQFKPVELCDAITDEQLAEIDASMEVEPIPAALVEPAKTTEPKETVEAIEEVVAEAKQEEKEEVVEELQLEEQQLPQVEVPIVTEKPASKKKWLTIAATIVAIALVAGIASHYMRKGTTEPIAQTDTIATTQSAASPVVTDTLRNGYRLFDMAKRHYGDQAFWVYIALENQQQFSDYHKIPKGKAIVIPPAEKYGINSDSKQSLRKASIAAVELHKQWKEQNKEDTKKIALEEPANKKEEKLEEETQVEDAKAQKPSKRTHRHHNRHHRALIKH